MTLRKESGLVFILVFEETAANTGSKSLLKTTPTKLSLAFPLWLLLRLLISCDFHSGNYIKEEQGEGLDIGGWLDFISKLMEGKETRRLLEVYQSPGHLKDRCVYS